MSDPKEDVCSTTAPNILEDHRLIVWLFYYFFQVLSYTTPTGWWLYFGDNFFHVSATALNNHTGISKSKINFFSKNVCKNSMYLIKASPLWQDIGVLFHAIFTVIMVLLLAYWKVAYCLLWYIAWWLIIDMITYHTKVLIFDEMDPDPHPTSNFSWCTKKNMVWSHRRILFQAVINYGESIFLFAFLYHSVLKCPHTFRACLKTSFEVATLHSETIDWTYIHVIQIVVSIFFLTVVITTAITAVYKRKELAP